MGYRNLGNRVHSVIHLIAVSGIAIGLPLNKIVLSLSLMIAGLNLIIEADFRLWWPRIKSNKTVLLISAFWILHLAGLLWSTELDYGLRDIRVKIPLIVIPLILAIKPLDRGQIRFVLFLFLGSLLITSVLNYSLYQGWLGSIKYDDIRGMSLFGSHIRYGVMIGFGANIALYLSLKERKTIKIILLLCLFWFIYYTWYSQVISGALALFAGLSGMLTLYLFDRNRKLAFSFIVLLIALPLAGIIWIYSGSTVLPITQTEISRLPEKTAEGNPYVHYFVDIKDSKGNYLYVNFCEKEIQREWQKVSVIPYYGADLKGQKVRFTLIRYMTSKGLKKDAVDFHKLTKKDIENIEQGIAEVEDGQSGLLARMNSIKYQIRSEADPNGHSLLQRIEYWKTGLMIIANHPISGVGTGDVQVAFDEQYEKNNSPLTEDNRLRAHNTYLTTWITFGVFGFIFFVALVWFVADRFKAADYLGVAFMVICFVTFMIEDSLETQAGVTFFAYFWGLFQGRNVVSSS